MNRFLTHCEPGEPGNPQGMTIIYPVMIAIIIESLKTVGEFEVLSYKNVLDFFPKTSAIQAFCKH